MPFVLRIGPFRFFFYSNENAEPPHIHVQNGRCLAKSWLDPGELCSSVKLKGHELRRIDTMVQEHRPLFLRTWNDYFDA